MSNFLTSRSRKLANIVLGIMVLSSVWGMQAIAMEDSPQVPEPEAPAVDPKLEELEFFTNEWRCEGEDSEKNTIPPFQWSMIRELNDLWFFAQSRRSPEGIYEVETLGYNTLMGKFGRTIVGNDGKFANFLSDGWTENTLVWVGSSLNMVAKTQGKHQIVVTKTSDRSFTEVERMATGEDQWDIISTKNCALPETP